MHRPMRLDTVIICSNATQRGDGLVDLTGIGIDTFGFPAFPGTTRIPLFIRLRGPHETEEHHLIVQVRDADDQMQSESMTPVRFGPRPPGLPDGWEVQTVRVFGLDATFGAPGAYVLRVSLDSSEPISQPIFARLDPGDERDDG